MGFGASGTLGDTLVYSRWRGVPYARRYVIPGNPQTAAQQETRNIFRTLSQLWKQLPAAAVAPWNTFATGRPFLGVNRFTGDNIRVFRKPTTQTDMALFIGSPGARGGPAPSDLQLTGGALSIAAEIATPTLPLGWAITEVQGIAFPDQDPTENFVGPVTYASADTGPYDLDFTGLQAATDYVVAVWIEYARPDGTAAYSISLGAVESTT
jgi:hypothetical protein